MVKKERRILFLQQTPDDPCRCPGSQRQSHGWHTADGEVGGEGIELLGTHLPIRLAVWKNTVGDFVQQRPKAVNIRPLVIFL